MKSVWVWVCWLALARISLLPSYRGWEIGALSSAVGWNKLILLAASGFSRREGKGAGVVFPRM